MAVKLGTMIGPLPVAGWVGVVGGGLGLAYMSSRRSAEEAMPVVEEEEDFGYPSIPALVGPTGLAPSPISVSPDVATTNSQWMGIAIRMVVQRGYDPFAAQQALQKWMEGAPLSADETAIITRAILDAGYPPDGAPVVRPADPVPPTPPVPRILFPSPQAAKPKNRFWVRTIIDSTGTVVNGSWRKVSQAAYVEHVSGPAKPRVGEAAILPANQDPRRSGIATYRWGTIPTTTPSGG